MSNEILAREEKPATTTISWQSTQKHFENSMNTLPSSSEEEKELTEKKRKNQETLEK